MSGSRSSGVACAASGNFTSCKDKNWGSKGEEEGGREERGRVCSWKTLRVPVILAGKEIDEEEKRRNKKIRDNLQIVSDVIY